MVFNFQTFMLTTFILKMVIARESRHFVGCDLFLWTVSLKGERWIIDLFPIEL